jgi:hypothetical protein
MLICAATIPLQYLHHESSFGIISFSGPTRDTSNLLRDLLQLYYQFFVRSTLVIKMRNFCECRLLLK